MSRDFFQKESVRLHDFKSVKKKKNIDFQIKSLIVFEFSFKIYYAVAERTRLRPVVFLKFFINRIKKMT